VNERAPEGVGGDRSRQWRLAPLGAQRVGRAHRRGDHATVDVAPVTAAAAARGESGLVEFCVGSGGAVGEQLVVEPGGQLFAQVHPDDREQVAADYETTFGGGPSFELDYRIVLASGVTRTLHGLGRRDPDRPDIYVGTVQDVTEPRQVEQQLRRERDYGAVITSSMHEGFILTRDGAILEVNPALCELTGFTREELVGAHAPYAFWAPASPRRYPVNAL
jgi:PAS domain-containing protein